MPLFEIEFKIRHNCRLGEFSLKHPSARIHVWKILDREVIEIVPNANGDPSDAMTDLLRFTGVEGRALDGQGGYHVAEANQCAVERILTKSTQHLDILPISPVVYCRGWQYHRIVAFQHEDINGLLDTFREASFMPLILRKTPFNGFTGSQMTVTLDSLFSDLTEKQTDAILSAYSRGYYRFPRDSSLESIALEMGVPRTTLQGHLKKAENKIIGSIVPHVHTWYHFKGSRGQHPMISEN
ncbi:MAG: helix-turn-helix domain-containing protein [Candidatus Thorarchaeota archaeon]|nr:MAG: helix-turn-helix domain-containing protein [Candidatus Thorarchaeota archaeon]